MMAVQRFVLDSTTLNNAGFGLDGGSAFVLDTSTLDSASVLDGGQFLTVAIGSSSLGGVSASASAQATLFPVLASSLGGLSATATAQSTLFPVLSSSLGGLDALASAQSTLFPVLSASLGGLDATASASSIIFPVLDAPLDGLVATATATVIPPEPPVIPPSGSRWWKQPAAPVKKQELPEQIVVEIPKPRRPVLVSARAESRLGGVNVGALGSITFSSLDDDAEVLLLV
jgi:hypothetical protein